MNKHLVSGIFLAVWWSLGGMAQEELTVKPDQNWHLLDMSADGIGGVSVNRAYQDLLVGKESKTVVVAVLDGGIDPEHEDLKANMWVNPGEIAGNGVDDDGNGYVDDVYGWNFIGGPNGDVNQDNLEFTRVYKDLKQRFENRDPKSIKGKEKKEYKEYLKMDEEYKRRVEKSTAEWNEFAQVLSFYEISKSTVANVLGKEDYTLEEVSEMPADNEFVMAVKEFMVYSMENDLEYELEQGREHFEGALKYAYNLDFDSREIVGDNYADLSERYYGNNNVEGPAAGHGTHVAGIIAGVRGNGIGIEGICEDVKIMAVRVVPQGDERDKDIANAIRYAIDNGAHIINMSFGKGYSPQKQVVDEAVAYAAEKGVLLIHAAGNDSDNNDVEPNFPNAVYESSREQSPVWIEVGASSWKTAPYFVADFSNYGRKSVDVFAPGEDIYSTMPDDSYRFQSGTSMAAPVVAGVAALVKSYYPELSAVDLRNILLNSYTDYSKAVCVLPGDSKELKFGKLCTTGGIINAYNALKMAEEFRQKKNGSK